MNKTILSILLIALVSTISAQEQADAFQIDFETCFTSAAKLAHDVKIALAAIHSDPASISTVLTDIYASVEDVNPLLHSCSIDIKLIDKLDAFTFTNTNLCFSNLDTIANATSTFISMIKEKQIIQDLIPIVQTLQTLLKILPSAKQNCSLVAKPNSTLLLADGFELNFNLIKCFQEAKQDVDAAKQLIQDYKNSTLPIEDIFEETINLYNNAVVTFRDCGVDVLHLPTVDNVASLKVCVKDGAELFNKSKEAIEDIKTLNLNNLFPTLKAIYADAVEIQNVCIVKKPAFLSN
ncbi:hypothetical protein ABPG72_013024 [Tetrahymena utriculariae]